MPASLGMLTHSGTVLCPLHGQEQLKFQFGFLKCEISENVTSHQEVWKCDQNAKYGNKINCCLML